MHPALPRTPALPLIIAATFALACGPTVDRGSGAPLEPRATDASAGAVSRASAGPSASAGAAESPSALADTARMVFSLRGLGLLKDKPVVVSLDVPRSLGVKLDRQGNPELSSCGAARRQLTTTVPGEIELGLALCPEGADGKACVDVLSAGRGAFWSEGVKLRREGADPLRQWTFAEGLNTKNGETQRTGQLLVYHPEARVVVSCGYSMFTRVEDHAQYREVCDTLALPPSGTPVTPIAERKASVGGASLDNSASVPDGAAIAELARGYVKAMGKRDAKAAAAFLLGESDCKRMTKKGVDVAPCAKQVEKMLGALPQLFKHYPEGFEPAGVELKLFKEGVYDVSLYRKGAECEATVGLIVARFGDMWRVAIPMRVEEAPGKAPKKKSGK